MTPPFSSTDEMVKYLRKKGGRATDAVSAVAIVSGSTAGGSCVKRTSDNGFVQKAGLR